MSMRVRRCLLGVTFFAIAIAMLHALAQLPAVDGRGPFLPLWLVVLAGLITTVVAVAYVVTTPDPSVEPLAQPATLWSTTRSTSTPRSALAPPRPEHPYRSAFPKPASPRTSARRTALVVAACLAVTATAIPLALHRPRWVEIEVVLAAWWILWAVIMTVVAHRGEPVDDDHAFTIHLPWSTTSKAATPSSSKRYSGTRSWPFDLLSGAGDFDALVFALGLALLLGVALFSAWLMIEVVLPVLFLLAYLGVVRALRRTEEHRGSAWRAGFTGAGWATAYVAPLAGAVWLVHVL